VGQGGRHDRPTILHGLPVRRASSDGREWHDDRVPDRQCGKDRPLAQDRHGTRGHRRRGGPGSGLSTARPSMPHMSATRMATNLPSSATMGKRTPSGSLSAQRLRPDSPSVRLPANRRLAAVRGTRSHTPRCAGSGTIGAADRASRACTPVYRSVIAGPHRGAEFTRVPRNIPVW
jgi:hypothetical protein